MIWDNNPLSIYSKVEQTYVDGKLFFSADKNLRLMERDLKEKMRIINKMGNSKDMEKTQKIKIDQEKIYHCETIEDYE